MKSIKICSRMRYLVLLPLAIQVRLHILGRTINLHVTVHCGSRLIDLSRLDTNTINPTEIVLSRHGLKSLC